MYDIDEQVWNDWKIIRKAKKTTPEPTLTTMRKIVNEGMKLGWSPNETVTYCVEMEWKGFKAEWVKQDHVGFIERHQNRSWSLNLQ